MILSPDADERLWTVGCVPELAEQVKHKAGVFAGIGVGIAFIQLNGIVFACLLARPFVAAIIPFKYFVFWSD